MTGILDSTDYCPACLGTGVVVHTNEPSPMKQFFRCDTCKRFESDNEAVMAAEQLIRSVYTNHRRAVQLRDAEGAHRRADKGKRMNIILDCDGVLSDFSGGVIAELNKRTGSDFGIEDVTDWNMARCLGVKSQLIYDIASERGFCEGLEVLPGAKEGVAALQEIGEVYIMTSPIWSSKRWMHERTNWLLNHFNLHCSHVIHGSAKDLALGADLFVDDKPATVVKWLTARNHRFNRYDVRGAVLWAAPWNIHEQASIPDYGFGAKLEQHIIRTNSWPTLADIAEKI